MGENENTCRESWFPDHFGDRNDLDLLGRQNDLARAVLALGKPTAVLLINGRPLAINELATNAPAILEGWYLGQEQGTAVARVLFGEVNPGGKLTVTIPRSVGDLPGLLQSQAAGSRAPVCLRAVFAALSVWSRPELHDLPLRRAPGQSRQRPRSATRSPCRSRSRNTGDRAGDEVVQLYVRDLVGSVTRPVKELKDFQRITLAPGESKRCRSR